MLQGLLLCPAPVIAEWGGEDACQLGADLTKQGSTSHYSYKAHHVSSCRSFWCLVWSQGFNFTLTVFILIS